MSQPVSVFRLTRLPADIHKLVIAAIDAPSPLFLPTYEVQQDTSFTYGNLIKKQEEYYGKRSDHDLQSAQALLSLSRTCRFYRDLISPIIFSSIMLRSKARSLSSIRTLSETPHWQHVKSLSFAGTYVTEEADPTSQAPRNTKQIDLLKKFDYEGLSTILSRLPPNLEQLSLDFPTDWIEESDDYLSVFDEDETPGDTLELETEDSWRKLIFTVLKAVAQNDLSAKASFELKLLNVPPLPCSVYWSAEFHQLLKCVSDLTLAFDHFDNGAGWHMNTMEAPVKFASKFGEWFWSHLDNVQSLTIHADDSWPIGLAPGRCHTSLALPDAEFRFHKLKTLDLRWWLIDEQFITFVTKHMPKLQHLAIANYFASSIEYSSSEADDAPTWATFFSALSSHPTLKSLTLVPHLSGLRLLDPYHQVKEPDSDVSDELRTIWGEVSILQASRASMIETSKWTTRDNARMKRLWPHCALDSKYGSIFDDEECNAERFREASDHEAWLRLCDVLEARDGSARIMDMQGQNNEG